MPMAKPTQIRICKYGIKKLSITLEKLEGSPFESVRKELPEVVTANGLSWFQLSGDARRRRYRLNGYSLIQ
jgi:hypothetical protein